MANENELEDPVLDKSVAEIFGEIVWLMTQDAGGRAHSIAALEALVMPPILLRQFHIKYQPSVVGINVEGQAVATPSALQPFEVELFALCSTKVLKELDSNPSYQLSLSDWTSGTVKRIVAKFGVNRGQ